MICAIPAPLCPTPPEVTLEGVREFAPVAFQLAPVDSCALTEETISLTCHSFLSVYLQSASFGRTEAAEEELCDGEKEDDRASPDKDCLDTRAVLQQGRDLCHGRSSCSLAVSQDMADFTGCMSEDLKRELRTSHICGNNLFHCTIFTIVSQWHVTSGLAMPQQSLLDAWILPWYRTPG